MFKRVLKKSRLLVEFSRAIKFVWRYLIPNHPRMLSGELDLFIKILPQIKTLIDVGARYDVDYIELSQGRQISYHLFEVNPRYFSILFKKLKSFKNENIVANDCGIGSERTSIVYHLNSESLIDRFPNRFIKIFSKKVDIITLKSYCDLHQLETIDFLKTDIEHYDYFALKGLGKKLQDVKFVQFELGLGAPYMERHITNDDYFSLFTNRQKFYFVMDENNPAFENVPEGTTLVSFGIENLPHIETVQATGIGFNVLAVRNDMTVSLSEVSIFDYDEALFSSSLNDWLNEQC